MYWYVLILTVQPSYAALRLDSLLRFCQADRAVLETSVTPYVFRHKRRMELVELSGRITG